MSNDDILNELLALESRAELLTQDAKRIRKKIQSAMVSSQTHPSGQVSEAEHALIVKMTTELFQEKRLKSRR